MVPFSAFLSTAIAVMNCCLVMPCISIKLHGAAQPDLGQTIDGQCVWPVPVMVLIVAVLPKLCDIEKLASNTVHFSIVCGRYQLSPRRAKLPDAHAAEDVAPREETPATWRL